VIPPSSLLHPSFIPPSSFLHPSFILPSSFLHPSFILPSSLFHPSFILPSSLLHPSFIPPSSLSPLLPEPLTEPPFSLRSHPVDPRPISTPRLGSRRSNLGDRQRERNLRCRGKERGIEEAEDRSLFYVGGQWSGSSLRMQFRCCCRAWMWFRAP
jgi:hypothetical protein